MKKWEIPQVKIDQFVSNEYVASCSGAGIQCEAHIISYSAGAYIYDPASSIGGPQNSHPNVTGGNHTIGERCTVTLNIQQYTFTNNRAVYFDANGNKTSNSAPENGYVVYRHKTSTPGYYVYCFKKCDKNGYQIGDGYHYIGGGTNPNS